MRKDRRQYASCFMTNLENERLFSSGCFEKEIFCKPQVDMKLLKISTLVHCSNIYQFFRWLDVSNFNEKFSYRANYDMM